MFVVLFFSSFSATRHTRRPLGPSPRSEGETVVVISLRNASLLSNRRLRCGGTPKCRFGKALLVPLWAELGHREQKTSTDPGALRSLRRRSKEPWHCFIFNFLILCCTFFSVEVSNDRTSTATCNYHRPGKKKEQQQNPEALREAASGRERWRAAPGPGPEGCGLSLQGQAEPWLRNANCRALIALLLSNYRRSLARSPGPACPRCSPVPAAGAR